MHRLDLNAAPTSPTAWQWIRETADGHLIAKLCLGSSDMNRSIADAGQGVSGWVVHQPSNRSESV